MFACVFQRASHCCEHRYWTVTINVPYNQSPTWSPHSTDKHPVHHFLGYSYVSLTEFGAHRYFTHNSCIFSPWTVLIDRFEKQTYYSWRSSGEWFCLYSKWGYFYFSHIPSLVSCNMMSLWSIWFFGAPTDLCTLGIAKINSNFIDILHLTCHMVTREKM